MIVDPMQVLPKLPTVTYGTVFPTVTVTSVSTHSIKTHTKSHGSSNFLSSIASEISSAVSSFTASTTVSPTSTFVVVPTGTHSSSHSHSSVGPLPTVMPGGAPIYEAVGDAGKRTLWVVFVMMVIAALAFTAMAWRVPVAKRLYHMITTSIVIIAALSYFAMATGDGISYHHIKVNQTHKHVPDTTEHIYRQVFWARYVDWSLTTPLLLLDLCLVAGMNGGHILMTVGADLVMILTGLFAAFGNEGTPQKWGWYTIACIAYLVVIWHLALHGRAMAMQKGNKVGGFFAALAGFTLILWTAYPIVWGIADGSRKVSVDAEIICYAVLDVLAKGVFGFWLLLSHMNMPELDVTLGGFWAHGFSSEGQLRVGDDEEGA